MPADTAKITISLRRSNQSTGNEASFINDDMAEKPVIYAPPYVCPSGACRLMEFHRIHMELTIWLPGWKMNQHSVQIPCPSIQSPKNGNSDSAIWLICDTSHIIHHSHSHTCDTCQIGKLYII
jgi:hypothetical protein